MYVKYMLMGTRGVWRLALALVYMPIGSQMLYRPEEEKIGKQLFLANRNFS